MTALHGLPAALPSVDEVRALVLAMVAPLGFEDVALDDALGRILAAGVLAGADLPGVDNSSMDGYAVRAADIATASPLTAVTLPRGAESRAGLPAPQHRAGTATLVATGAPMPAGADAVVPVELVHEDGGAVIFTGPATAGAFVRRRGEDVTAGTEVLSAGVRLRSVDVGVCAAAGHATVRVARRPRVALLAGGDELVSPGTVPLPHQVVDANTAMLAAAVVEAGGIPVALGAVGDDPLALEAALSRARDSADLVVSSAGVSMGRHDHVRATVARLGTVDAWQVAMRPGKPLVVGRIGSVPFLGLPGNPVSAAVTFLLFARPAILAMQGAAAVLPRSLPARLAEGATKPRGLETYMRVTLHAAGGGMVATSSGGQGSHMLRALGDADALAVLPAGVAEVAAGETVSALIIP